MKFKKVRKPAFTIAEILITLGLIGVVAAVTIPTIVNHAHRKGYLSLLQKTYSSVSIGVSMLMAEEMAFDLEKTYLTEDSGGLEGIGRFLKTNFNVIKDCGVKDEEHPSQCLGSEYVNLEGSPVAYIPPLRPSYCVMIGSGETICMYQYMTNHDAKYERTEEVDHSAHGNFSVVIDVNGPVKPNQSGIDLFTFDIYTDGKVTESYYTQRPERCFEAGNDYASGCFSRVKDNGWKFDY